MARWKKGQSGNLKGRPHGSLNKSTLEIKELLAAEIPFRELVNRLYTIAMRGNVRAAEVLLAYRYGRPSSLNENELAESIEMELLRKKAQEALKDLETMPLDELQQNLLERLRLSNKGIIPTG